VVPPSARFTLRERERFLRIEVVGPCGERTWTNPLFVDW